MEQILRIGIIGPGGIAHKFADAAKRLDNVRLAAVASRNEERAKAFAEEFGIETAYGSYDALYQDPEIDAVYISVLNTFHYEAAKKALEAGKAVMCEKPFCMTTEETEELIRLSEEKGLLLMEAVWSLFLPCVVSARNWIRDGKVGSVKYLDSNFTFFAPVDPKSRLFDPVHGGGGALDVGIYCLAFSMSMMGEAPKECISKLFYGQTNVDEMGAALLTFPNGTIANCAFGLQGNANCDAHIYGSSGSIVIPEFWQSHEASLYDTDGKLIEHVTDPQENGFVYEIEAFREAFYRGKYEVETISHDMMRGWARVLEEIRKA